MEMKPKTVDDVLQKEWEIAYRITQYCCRDKFYKWLERLAHRFESAGCVPDNVFKEWPLTVLLIAFYEGFRCGTLEGIRLGVEQCQRDRNALAMEVELEEEHGTDSTGT